MQESRRAETLDEGQGFAPWIAVAATVADRLLSRPWFWPLTAASLLIAGYSMWTHAGHPFPGRYQYVADGEYLLDTTNGAMFLNVDVKHGGRQWGYWIPPIQPEER